MINVAILLLTIYILLEFIRGRVTKPIIAFIIGGIVGTILVTAFFYLTDRVNGAETCPDSGEWTKIDNGDLSLYPVEGAVEYCFKAGTWITGEIPDGGFGQEGACDRDIQYCDLSHWSYRVIEAEPTLTPTPSITPEPSLTPRTDPSPTPTEKPVLTPTTTPTNTPKPTITPTPKPEPTATPKPEDPKDEWDKVLASPEIYPAGDK